jgi:hypothetical protein
MSASVQVAIDRRSDFTKKPWPMEALKAALLRKLRGYSRKRTTPVLRAELLRWFRGTAPWAIDMALTDLLDCGQAYKTPSGWRLAKFTVELRRADGSLVDRTFHEAEDEARGEFESLHVDAEPGERAVLRRAAAIEPLDEAWF